MAVKWEKWTQSGIGFQSVSLGSVSGVAFKNQKDSL